MLCRYSSDCIALRVVPVCCQTACLGSTFSVPVPHFLHNFDIARSSFAAVSKSLEACEDELKALGTDLEELTEAFEEAGRRSQLQLDVSDSGYVQHVILSSSMHLSKASPSPGVRRGQRILALSPRLVRWLPPCIKYAGCLWA